MLHSDDAGGGQDARLAHAAAQHLAGAAGAVDEILVTAQQGTHGGAQPLGQAKGHRVDVLGQLAHVYAQGHAGVKDPSAIQVYLEPVLVGDLAYRGEIVRGDGGPTAVIVRVFQGDEPAMGVMGVVGPHRGLDVVEADGAVRLVGQRSRMNPAQRGHPPCFV